LRRIDDPPQQPAANAEPEPLEQQQPDRRHAERTDVDPLGPVPLERPLELRRKPRELREQEADGLGVDAAGREREHLARRRVEPLEVVDRDDHRRRAGERAQQVEQPERDRVRLGRRTGGHGPQQRDLERQPLRRRQCGERLLLDPVDQVDERGEGELRLRAARTGREYPAPTCPRGRDRRLPQRRLADAGVALENEDGGAAAGSGDEPLDRGELGDPADHERSIRRPHPLS
jgi:hypothetical protein